MLHCSKNIQNRSPMTDFYGRTLSEPEIGYLAGIMDGEGTIHISRPISRSKDCKSPIYQTYIAVTNTEMCLLTWLQERIGGIIRSIPTDKKTDAIRRPIWRWYCPIYRIAEFCKLLIPYSIIKRREFEIMLEIRGTYRNQAKQGKQGIQKVPDADIAIRHRCYLELKDLHIRPNLRHPNLNRQNSDPTSQ